MKHLYNMLDILSCNAFNDLLHKLISIFENYMLTFFLIRNNSVLKKTL